MNQLEHAELPHQVRPSWRGAASQYLLRRFPAIRKMYWSFTYELIGRVVGDDECIFMNFGYATEDDAAQSKRSRDHFPLKLYERVIGPVDLSAREILEVGSGRGGGAGALYAKHGPARYVGLDLANTAVDRCKRQFEPLGLEFVQGDAMKMPFPNASFDVVINVESSHCYPSRPQFFAEVARVLRPGGHFLFADLIWPNLDAVETADLDVMLETCGLSIIENEDITQNVLRSRALSALDPQNEIMTPALRFSASKLFNGPRRSRKIREEALAYPGSLMYACLSDGRASYRRWVLSKPCA